MAEKNVEVIDKESKQYIVVMVGSEQYGIDISYIDNIVRMQKRSKAVRRWMAKRQRKSHIRSLTDNLLPKIYTYVLY